MCARVSHRPALLSCPPHPQLPQPPGCAAPAEEPSRPAAVTALPLRIPSRIRSQPGSAQPGLGGAEATPGRGPEVNPVLEVTPSPKMAPTPEVTLVPREAAPAPEVTAAWTP